MQKAEGGDGEGGGWAVVALSCWLHPFLLCHLSQQTGIFKMPWGALSLEYQQQTHYQLYKEVPSELTLLSRWSKGWVLVEGLMGRGVQLLLRRVCQYRNDASKGTMAGQGCQEPPVLIEWRKITSMQITQPCLGSESDGGSLGIRQVCCGLHRH